MTTHRKTSTTTKRKTTPYKPKDFPKTRPKTIKRTTKRSVQWAKDEPVGEERIEMYKKCPHCILVPPKAGEDKNDPANYKFPICTKLSKTGGKCQYNCKGIVGASRRARLTKKYPKVEALTEILIERWECTKKAAEMAQRKRQSTASSKTVRKKRTTKSSRSTQKKKTTTAKKSTKRRTTTTKVRRKTMKKSMSKPKPHARRRKASSSSSKTSATRKKQTTRTYRSKKK